MNGRLRAELLKGRSTRTALYLLVTMIGLVALAVALHVLTLGADRLSTRANQLEVFQVGTRVGMIFAALAGAMTITAEVRHGTIRPTFLVTPRRGPVIAAKLVVSALAGLVLGLVAEGLMASAASAAFAARGIEGQLTSRDYLQLSLGGAAAAGLWAIIGLGVGAIVREQAATLVGLLVWMLLIENLLPAFVPNPSRFLPGVAGSDLAGNADTLPLAAAAFLLVVYATVTAAAGWLATVRRDVA